MSDGEVDLPVEEEEELVLDGATCASFFFFFEDFLSVGGLEGSFLFLDVPEFVVEELFPLGFFPDFEVFLGSDGPKVVFGRTLSTVGLFISFSCKELELTTFALAGVLASIKVLLVGVVFTVVLTSTPCLEELKISSAFIPEGMQPSATKGVLRRALSALVSRNDWEELELLLATFIPAGGISESKGVLVGELSTIVLYTVVDWEELELLLATFTPVRGIGAEEFSTVGIFSVVLLSYLSSNSIFTSASALGLAMAGGETGSLRVPAREPVNLLVSSHAALHLRHTQVPSSPLQV